MNITRFSISRPIGISMIFLFFIVLGLYSFQRIGVELLPALNTPFVTVSVNYTGAGAEEVETKVIKPLEEALSSLSKLKQMTSYSRPGNGMIVLEFEFSANADFAAIDATKKVDAIRRKLPDNIDSPVVYKRDVNATPVMEIAIGSSQSLYDTYAITDKVFREYLQRVAGVSEIQLQGGRQKEISVELIRDKLALYRISPSQVIAKIKGENQTTASGRVYTATKETDIRVVAEYETIEQIGNVQINSSDTVVPLRELAVISEKIIRPTRLSRSNGQESVSLTIYKNSDANLLETNTGLREVLTRLRTEFPQYEFRLISDSSEYVSAALRNTLWSLLEGIMTTGIILYLFLRSWRSTVTVLVAIPTSLLSTLFIMYLAGFTFNLMSLMGMALCIGILVDDSIVVLENIQRHLRMGKNPAQAAEEGRNEIGLAAIAITLCDIVVFLPIAFMTGLTGQFFRQFGLTIVFATLISLFVSFTLTPMLSSKLFRKEEEQPSGKIWRSLENGEERLTALYERVLYWCLAKKKQVIAGALVLFFGTLALIPLKVIGAEYMPRTDEAQFRVYVELPVGRSLESTAEALKKVETYMAELPEVKNILSYAGMPSSNMGSITVQLKKKKDRSRSVWEVTDDIRQWSRKNMMGVTVRISETQTSVSGVASTQQGPSAPVQVEIKGQDMDEILAASARVQEVLAGVRGLKDIRSTYREGQPELQLKIDRERVKFFNTSVAEVTSAVKTAIAGEQAGLFRQRGDEIDITVRFKNGDIFSKSDIRAIPLASSSSLVFVGDVAQIKDDSGPVVIRRVDKQRAINIQANLTDRPLEEVLSEVSGRLSGEKLGTFVTWKLTGQAEQMKETFLEMGLALALSLVLVYIILAILYESLITPVIRMFSLPLGMIGSLLFLVLTGNTINLFSLIGILMMDGLVAKNGTLLIDYALTLMERGCEPLEAIVEAGKTRLRPIIMTTMTMVFGMLPTALAIAEGAENRVSMAWVLIGGLLSSTFFTLIVIPIIFLYFYRRRATRDSVSAQTVS